jgi:hypothetical protein
MRRVIEGGRGDQEKGVERFVAKRRGESGRVAQEFVPASARRVRPLAGGWGSQNM